MSKNISLDSVRSGRICPANLGVRSCPVRKLICPVRSSPNSNDSNKMYCENMDMLMNNVTQTLITAGLEKIIDK